MGTEEQADFTKLQEAVNTLETDEHAAATQFAALAQEITELKAGQVITPAQINELTAKATTIGQALKEATEKA